MSDAASSDLSYLRELIEAQRNLRRALLDITRLSEQQCHIPAAGGAPPDRADALLAIMDRKQQALRRICALDAPALFRACARAVAGNGHGADEIARAAARLRAEAHFNLELWHRLVEAEERARDHWEAYLVELGGKLSSAQRKDALQRAYDTGATQQPPARFVDQVR